MQIIIEKCRGFGHIDFDNIISTLKNISYYDTLSYEPIISNGDYQEDLTFGKKYIENIESKR
ncbi:MAG: hypothetical protein ABJB76_12750 [Candidatus Nitrosocosmicus sp.]